MRYRVERISEFEGLRAFLAWWVVACHFLIFSGLYRHPRLMAHFLDASQAVAVFMILSGFVISRLLLCRIPYREFIVQRCFRLYPIFLLAFLASAFLEHTFGLGGSFDYGVPAFVRYPWWDFGSHALMLHGLVPIQIAPGIATSYLPPAWSISLEWQFYLLAPWLVRFIYRPDLPSSLVVAALALLRVLSHAHLLGAYDMNAFLPLRFELFLLGIASSRLWDFWPQASSAFRRQLPRLAGLGVLIFFAFTRSLTLPIWTLVLFTALECRHAAPRIFFRGLRAVLAAKPAQWLGRISYSTYLIHWPILAALHTLCFHALPGLSELARVSLLALTGPLLITAGSFLTYRWIEAPAIRYGKSLFPKTPHPHPAL